MTFIPINFDDAQEPKPVDGGKYSLQIVKAETAESGPNSKRPGSPQLKVLIGFADEPNAPAIMQFISLPHEEDEKKSADFKALLLKRFLTMFSVPFDANGIDTERLCMDMIGATAVGDVTLDEPDANGNVYNRLKVPPLRGESNVAGRARPPR